MKLVSLVVGFAAIAGSAFASTAKATAPRAWTISSANATAPEEVLGKHREFVKVWTITGSTPVGALQFAAAGPVFVDYDATLNSASTPAPTTETPTVAPTEAPTTEAPTTEAPTTVAPTTVAPVAGSSDGSSQAPIDGVVSLAAAADDATVVAKVIFSGNCTALLDELEVVEHDGALKVHFKNGDFQGFGYLLTEVVVATKAAVAKLSTSDSSSVYVGEGVVVSGNDSAASIAISGDGDVLVTAPSTDFSLRALNLKVSGSGDIQFQAASLAVNGTLWSKISGDATIAVVAKSVDVAQAIESKISGDGAVYVQADDVRTATIDSKISGDGDITISKNGSCVSQEIHISGEGNVATGSILCENTTLHLSGEGNVLVQTSGTFRVPHEIDDGKVQYVGAAPQLITDGRKPRPPHSKRPKHHGWYLGWWDDEDSEDDEDDEESSHFLPKSVTAAPENVYKTYSLKDVPAREPAFLVLTITRSFWGPDPSEHVVISIFGWDIDISGGGEHSFSTATQRLAARVQEQHGPAGAAALGVGAVAAVVAVGVAVHKVAAQRRRRREYTPLLGVVTN